MYDYLIVGSGLFGAIIAHELKEAGKNVLVIEKRPHIGGNIYTKEIEQIQVHQYGPHIFHTSDKGVWDYIQKFAEFNRYTNSPIARYYSESYNLPFNMNTFHQMWGVTTPEEARQKLQEQIAEANITSPGNLEEQALSMVGTDIYEKLIKGYTQKQWGRSCTELPPFIIKRLPVRFVYDNNYFNDIYQGIPIDGYTQIIEKMLNGVEVRLNTDFFSDRKSLVSQAKRIIFTGMIDEYYEYCFGELEYRSLRFEKEVLDCGNYQGNAVINYTAFEVPYTRIIEHKHFELQCQGECKTKKTVITHEYPAKWQKGDEPYYPVNDQKNDDLYNRYLSLSKEEQNVVFGGRLGLYKYLDMHVVVAKALECVRCELNEN